MSIQVAILGASGYTGAETIRLLSQHPECEIAILTGDSTAGTEFNKLYPNLARFGAPIRRFEDVRTEIEQCDVVFSCLPHGASMDLLPALENRLVIDLSADFRLPSPDAYREWYGWEHRCPNELGRWTYGLPELFREHIPGATRIANPGCYPTSVALAAAPLLKAGLIEPELVVAAITGTSGAGRTAKADLQFSHLEENVFAYKLGKHQHTAEMEMSISRFSGQATTVSFTAQIGPYVRGILAVCSAKLRKPISSSELLEQLRDTYRNEKFVQVLDTPPGTKLVRGSNFAFLSAAVDNHAGRVQVVSVIDNLTKGAAGQAVQNMNIALGLEETLGLGAPGIYP